MDNLAYVGGKRGGYGPVVMKSSKIITAGAEVLDPKLVVSAGKQKKFKRKPGSAVHALGKVVEKIQKEIGVKNDTLKKIRADIAKEKAKFRSVMNRAATHLKKTGIKKGSTIKNAKAEAERLKAAMKEDLKELIAHHTYLALKEFNGRVN